MNIHTLDGYDVRAQVIALVRDHLKPGEFFKKRDEVGDGAFRRLARKCDLDLLYRVAKADSLGRNADWVPREKWFDAEAQEWFIERVRELELKKAPAPILLGRHLLEMGLNRDRASAKSRERFTRCSWMGACSIWTKRRKLQRDYIHRLRRLHRCEKTSMQKLATL